MVEITAPGLRDVLDQIGQCFRYPGRLYLVGGSSLILVGAKISTLDIDLKLDVSSEHYDELIRCLNEIGRRSQIPIEQASPDQFIPLPAGYKERHQYVGRFGSLDVYHFDFYSVALSKLLRGNDKDFDDVAEMARQNLIEAGQLRSYYLELLPQLESFRVGADPHAFERNFTEFEKQLGQE